MYPSYLWISNRCNNFAGHYMYSHGVKNARLGLLYIYMCFNIYLERARLRKSETVYLKNKWTDKSFGKKSKSQISEKMYTVQEKKITILHFKICDKLINSTKANRDMPKWKIQFVCKKIMQPIHFKKPYASEG